MKGVTIIMKLKKFRVQNFRSIIDSTWIDCDDVTNIIGINEAGKSNALIALWKLFPASNGKINLLEDLPRNKYATLKDSCSNIKFIEAIFELDENEELLQNLIEITKRPKEELCEIYISRLYDGKYTYYFPNEKVITKLNTNDIKEAINAALSKLDTINPTISKEQSYKAAVKISLEYISNQLNDVNKFNKEQFFELKESLSITVSPSAKSEIEPLIENLNSLIDKKIALFDQKPINCQEVWEKVKVAIPRFVYYSNYGNLDSEIYLPHVIDNMQRTDVSEATAAKIRTLKVLFNFIGLNPTQILELGTEPQNPNPNQILEFTKKREERTVLLNSASSYLTESFRKWWKQGNYIFDLRADGKFFKIWVSDDKRPEKVSLESRSTGLQWFLSFYLTFLVETKKNLKNTILLLDEAGLSLHPLAQKDLINFFKELSKNNQIIHTTHSPFLVDTNNIDNVKIAYVDNDGHTVLSNNLRANTDPKHNTSIYAVHAALGLSVSDVLLHGCTPVIVEGPSDQYYLNAIKNVLISTGKFLSNKEIVFIPSGGVKGVAAIASIVSANTELPFVILDSDPSGEAFKEKLLKELYKDYPNKIISIGDIINKDNPEVEDLIPINYLEKGINKLFKDLDDFDIDDIYDNSLCILPQIENIASKNHISFPKGYKVDLAKSAKPKILKTKIDNPIIENWVKLFDKIK